MKLRHAGLLLGLFLCGFFPAATASELTLKRAQEMMLFRNSDMVIANQEYCKKAWEETEAKAVWYPSLDIVGSYNYFSQKNSIAFPDNLPIPGFAGQTLYLGNNYRAEIGADLSWPLTAAFVNTYNVRYNHLGLNAKYAQNQGLKNQLSFRLGAMYLQWSMCFQQVDVYNTLVAQLTELTAQTEHLKAGGVASLSKVLDVKARLGSAQADLVAAHNQCDSLKLELLNFVQCIDSGFVPDASPFVLDSQSIASFDTLSLNMTRPELIAIDENVDRLTVLQSIISGQKYPALIAILGARYANPGLSNGATDFMAYGQAGLQLRWNLFDGWKVSSQHKETDQQIEISKTQREQLVDSWTKAIKTAKLQVNRSLSQSEAAEASLAAAEALANDAKNNLAAGVAMQSDVLNALTARSRAALAVKQAAFMKNLAILQLYYASGRELKF